MSESYDVIVVGVGAMGAAACYHLAKRGARVLGLEQFDIPHNLGSSHGFSRMIRLAYYEHPDYVPLLRTAYTNWHLLEAESGHKLLHVTGGLYMGREGSEFLRRSREAADKHGLPYEMLNSYEAAERYPQFHLPETHVAMFEHNAGFLLPERCICAHAELAMRRGAEIHGHEPVVSWASGGGRVTVTTPLASYKADRVVFCGGAWSGKLLKNLGVELVVTRQILGWVWPKKPELFAMGRMPVWVIEHSDETIHYGFPMTSDNPGVKIAHHAPAERVDVDAVSRVTKPEDEDDFRPTLRRYLPDADGPLLSMRVCLYTNSPDSHFIVDRMPDDPRVIVACGFSGHGFKFASVMGQALADFGTTGKTNLPMGFLGLGRFKK